MQANKLIIIFFIAGFLLLGFVFFIASRLTVGPQIAQVKGVKTEVGEDSFDWGQIKLNGGNVEKEFTIKNAGEEVLKLFNIKTSCMCTTAQVISTKGSSPLFGMHERSGYVAEVAPGEEVKLKVVFDPSYHGPTGVGPIVRQINVSTNDPQLSLLTFTLTAMVTR